MYTAVEHLLLPTVIFYVKSTFLLNIQKPLYDTAQNVCAFIPHVHEYVQRRKLLELETASKETKV